MDIRDPQNWISDSEIQQSPPPATVETKQQKCLNCQQKINISSESEGQHQLKFIIKTKNRQTGVEELRAKPLTNVEILTFILELQQSQIQLLYHLNVNSMYYCPQCVNILADIYKTRNQFQALTSARSFLQPILAQAKRIGHLRSQNTSAAKTPAKSSFKSQPETNFFSEDNNSYGMNYLDGIEQTEPNVKENTYDEYEEVKSESHEFEEVKSESQSKSEEPDFLANYDEFEPPIYNSQSIPPFSVSNKITTGPRRGQLVAVVQQSQLEIVNWTCTICRDPEVPDDSKFLHIKTHLGTKDIEAGNGYNCFCGKNYTRLGILKALQTKVHPEQKLPHKCKTEFMKSKSKKIRKRHQAKCEICGKIYNSTAIDESLRNHMQLIHGQKSRWECDICAKSCQGSRSMNYHKRTHLGKHEKDERALIEEVGSFSVQNVAHFI